MPGGLIALVIAIVIISAVVGAIAQFLNKLNEMNAPPARRPNGGPARPASADKDMDRFLAEIDRLRRRKAEGGEGAGGRPVPPPAEQARPTRAEPVRSQQRPPADRPVPTAARPPVDRNPDRNPDRFKPRVVAELVEPRPQPKPEPTPRRGVDRGAMAAPPAPVLPGALSPEGGARPDDLPVASVVMPTSSTGAPATSVTRFARRPAAASKTALGRDLTALLGSGNGVATAVILQEILGPPKSKRR